MLNFKKMLLLSFIHVLYTNAQERILAIKQSSLNSHVAILIHDEKNDVTYVYNKPLCLKRCSPFSTFKLPHMLIALDLGVVKSEYEVLMWDGKCHAVEVWNRNHTLSSAVEYSVVWYFQEIAKRIGKPRMKTYLDLFKYGNTDLSGLLTSFWLGSSLKINLYEQLGFLRRFYFNSLPISERTTTIAKKILKKDKNIGLDWYGKTGCGMEIDQMSAWFIGYVERNEQPYFVVVRVVKSHVMGDEACEIGQDIFNVLLKEGRLS